MCVCIRHWSIILYALKMSILPICSDMTMMVCKKKKNTKKIVTKSVCGSKIIQRGFESKGKSLHINGIQWKIHNSLTKTIFFYCHNHIQKSYYTNNIYLNKNPPPILHYWFKCRYIPIELPSFSQTYTETNILMASNIFQSNFHLKFSKISSQSYINIQNSAAGTFYDIHTVHSMVLAHQYYLQIISKIARSYHMCVCVYFFWSSIFYIQRYTSLLDYVGIRCIHIMFSVCSIE